MRSLLLRLVIFVGVGAGATAAAHDFLGAESCQSCHAEAWSAWRASPHARAKEVLSGPQQKDARCLSCHSPAEADQRVTGVSCESCHGGGQYYSAKFVMKDAELARLVGLVDPSEKQCRSCHDTASPSVKPFEFNSKLKSLDHWSAERAKRADLVPKPAQAPTSAPSKPKPSSASMSVGGTR